MNLFLTGHGYQMLALPDAALTVPNNFTLKFYCKKTKMFDSTWEPFVVKAKGNIATCPNERGTADWEVTTIAAGSSFEEHCLTRPGKMKTYKDIGEMKEIKVPKRGTGVVSETVADGDILCIKGGKKQVTGDFTDGEPWISLSALMAALAQRAPSGATVHWCACRSVLDDPKAAIEQARSPYQGTL